MPIPLNKLPQHKAQARGGVEEDFSLLTGNIATLEQRDQLDVLDIYLDFLRSHPPPSVSDLQKFELGLGTLDTVFTKLQCHLARDIVLGTWEISHIKAHPTQDPKCKARIRRLWPYLWPWISELFCADLSFLSPETKQALWAPRSYTELFALALSLVGAVAHIQRGHPTFSRSLTDTPGLVPLVARQWFMSVSHSYDDFSMSPSANQVVGIFLTFLGPENTNGTSILERIVAEIGSPDDVAACLLGHIRRVVLVGIDHGHLIHDPLGMLTHVNEDIHISLLNQDAPRLAMDVIQYFLDAPRTELRLPIIYGSALEFLFRAFVHPSLGVSNLTLALERQVLVLIMRTANRRRAPIGSLSSLHYMIVIRLVELVREHLIFRSTLRAVAANLRTIWRLRLEPVENGFSDLVKMWRGLVASATEMLDIKANRRTAECIKCRLRSEPSDLQQCSACFAYYCSKTCQRDDWHKGTHRSICLPTGLIATKDFHFIELVTFKKMKEFGPELSMMYQLYVLSRKSLDFLPPMAVAINTTSYPTLIKCGDCETFLASQDPSRSQWAQHMRENHFYRPRPGQHMVVFATAPVGELNARYCIHASVDHEPTPPFSTYSEFLQMKGAIAGHESELRVLTPAISDLTKKWGAVKRQGKLKLEWMSKAGNVLPASGGA